MASTRSASGRASRARRPSRWEWRARLDRASAAKAWSAGPAAAGGTNAKCAGAPRCGGGGGDRRPTPMPQSSAPPSMRPPAQPAGGNPPRSARFRRGSRGPRVAPPEIPKIGVVEVDPNFKPRIELLPPKPPVLEPTGPDAGPSRGDERGDERGRSRGGRGGRAGRGGGGLGGGRRGRPGARH